MFCISLNSNELQLRTTWDEESLKRLIDGDISLRLSRGLLLLDAYLHKNQTDIIPDPFDIEHIFPKKGQNTNYNGWNREDAETYLDKLGNKVVLEKKLNIQAGNGYFGVKKKKYSLSSIGNVKDLANYKKTDGTKEDIEERERQLKTRIVNFLKEQLCQ